MGRKAIPCCCPFRNSRISAGSYRHRRAMRIRLMMRFGGKSATTSGMFLTAATTNPKPWLPMLGSLVAHGALLALVPLTADYLAQYYVDDLDWAAYHVEPLRVRTMPELVYYSAD